MNGWLWTWVLVGWVAWDDPDQPNDRTLGAKPPAGAIVLYDGGELDGWTNRDGSGPAGWTTTATHFTVKPGSGDIRTKAVFGDHRLHLEFNCPLMPEAKGQARGNSGVYLGGAYEIQVLDSYGLKPGKNDCAAVYDQVAPRVNACKPPLQWQTYDITFRKARRKDGQVVEKARVTVVHNGVTVIEDAEIDPTPGGVTMEAGLDGPLLLQDHGNEVEFRNIWVVPAR